MGDLESLSYDLGQGHIEVFVSRQSPVYPKLSSNFEARDDLGFLILQLPPQGMMLLQMWATVPALMKYCG